MSRGAPSWEEKGSPRGIGRAPLWRLRLAPYRLPSPNGGSGGRYRRDLWEQTQSDAAVRRMHTELMQYRRPVGGGPSRNRWPRWASQPAHVISVRTMP